MKLLLSSYLQLGRLLQGLLLLPFSVFAFNLELLKVALGLLAAVFRFRLALLQGLQLIVQLVELALQRLLGFLHGGLVLQEWQTRYSHVNHMKAAMSAEQPSHRYPFGLLQLFVEFVQCLKVLFSQLC